MSIVVSHRTARAFHQLPLPRGDLRRFPLEPAPLKTGAPCARSIAYARAALQRAGLAEEALENLEVIVSKPSERRVMPGITCHLLGGELPARTLLEIEKGVFVPDVRLCALEAASYLSLRELIEYYFELCGTYALFPGGNESYRKLKTVRTTTEDLRAFLLAMRQRNHAAKALRALRYVRDGSRSPMETATVMLLVLPMREGGLGIRSVTMNHEIPVTKAARKLTRRKTLICDAFIARCLLDIEYNGILHEQTDQRIIDAERLNALRAMGYEMLVIDRSALFSVLSFRRLMASIERHARIKRRYLNEAFRIRQEELRTFVLRNCRKPDDSPSTP